MDSSRFDHLALRVGRALEQRAERRRALTLAGALAAGLAVSAEDAGARSRSRGNVSAEACIATGKRCASKKPRGKKGKRLRCKNCCQRHVTTGPNGKQICACQPNGLPCTETRECCSGLCAEGACQAGQCSTLGTTCTVDQTCCSGMCDVGATETCVTCFSFSGADVGCTGVVGTGTVGPRPCCAGGPIVCAGGVCALQAEG